MKNIRPKNFLLISSVLLFSLIIIAYPYRIKIMYKVKALLGYSIKGHGGRDSGSCPTCPDIFTDNVMKHKFAYLNDGIKPQNTDSDLDKLSKSGKLEKIKTGKLYTIRNARFSRPYLLPKANSFIQELARNYGEKCKSDSIKYVPFTISSLTRSKESVTHLMKNNGNAIKNSSHLKGKTFDISYRAFNGNKKQTKAFIEVLNDLKRQKRCYVKFERNGCLHITVI
jgi:hypothetical protein